MNAGDADRVRVRKVETLADDWYVLRKYTFDYRRADGTWQTLSREAYDRGNGAVVLPYSRVSGTVVLTRQFRLPALVNGHPDGMLLEAPAGLLDAEGPESAVVREAEEETGLRLRSARPVLAAYMSPGSVTERLHFFVAEFDAGDRVAAGGGSAAEGEDIEFVELPLEEALAMVERGEIVDGKTVLLLYYARVTGLLATGAAAGVGGAGAGLGRHPRVLGPGPGREPGRRGARSPGQ